ncbi:hypothetical protein T08_10741 [Trichinella sp. T8]|nr:hypothetical protein T08_10741 [Trichinella sp. T8]
MLQYCDIVPLCTFQIEIFDIIFTMNLPLNLQVFPKFQYRISVCSKNSVVKMSCKSVRLEWRTFLKMLMV